MRMCAYKNGRELELIPGIYIKPDEDYTVEEVISERYLIRNGIHIGYLTGASFAYDLGLRSSPPERMSITTNKESMPHGRSITVLDVPLKIHGILLTEIPHFSDVC